MAQQLARAADNRKAMPLTVPRFNPYPAGVIQPGSASDVVLALLRGRSDVWMTHGQILVLTKRSTKAVCWALAYLQAQGLIESTLDDGRNARYRKYRAAKGERG